MRFQGWERGAGDPVSNTTPRLRLRNDSTGTLKWVPWGVWFGAKQEPWFFLGLSWKETARNT